jgi:K+-sensing histidine kinase KdpD
MLTGTTAEEKQDPRHRRRQYRGPDRATEHSVTDREQFIAFRLTVIRVVLVLSWLALAGFAYLGWSGPGLDDDRVWIPLALVGGALVVLSLMPWRRLLAGPVADGLILVWIVAAAVGIAAADVFHGGTPQVGIQVALVVTAAAMMVSPIVVVAAGLAAAGSYAYVLLEAPDLPTGETIFRYGVIAAVTLITAVLAVAWRRQLRVAADRLARVTTQARDVEDKERELDHLYAVSRTITSGSNLGEVLPELVGRVVDAVDARLGLVMLYSPKDQALEVMSPIWVAGHTVRTEEYLLPLTEHGLAQRVFVSGDPALDNHILDGELRDSLVADLDTQRVAAVPLQIEARPIGVLMVGDKPDEFTRDDLDTLASLAAPSALVLSQMARYEEARETGAKMAEVARLKTDFVSVVSHELRTPLTSIIGSLKTLARPELAPTHPDARQLLQSAEKQAGRLRTLIEDLLVVSRLDNRALPVRPETIEVPTFLTELVRSIPGADRRVMLDTDSDVHIVEADPQHLRRVLTNLIENGLKYATGSSIEIHTRTSGDEVWISVSDHGPGIPYELHEHVFDPFTQVEHAETRAKGGTGLGLSIVRGLAEAMGGRVWFEPTIGGGATFTVALPRTARSYTTTISARNRDDL